MTTDTKTEMNQCDYGHETRHAVKLLPIGGDGNAIVCEGHYKAEISFRRDRIASGVPFDLPKWDDLKIYVSK